MPDDEAHEACSERLSAAIEGLTPALGALKESVGELSEDHAELRGIVEDIQAFIRPMVERGAEDALLAKLKLVRGPDGEAMLPNANGRAPWYAPIAVKVAGAVVAVILAAAGLITARAMHADAGMLYEDGGLALVSDWSDAPGDVG